MMIDIRRIPRSKNSFKDIRRKNQIYVDHTDLIFEFACQSCPKFMTRPRRFGKSLLISTLESLFSHGTVHFKGLKIEKEMENYEKGKTYMAVVISAEDKAIFQWRIAD